SEACTFDTTLKPRSRAAGSPSGVGESVGTQPMNPPAVPSSGVPGGTLQSTSVCPGCSAAFKKNIVPTCSPQMSLIRGLVLLPKAHCIQRCCQVTSDAPKACECPGRAPASTDGAADTSRRRATTNAPRDQHLMGIPR